MAVNKQHEKSVFYASPTHLGLSNAFVTHCSTPGRSEPIFSSVRRAGGDDDVKSAVKT